MMKQISRDENFGKARVVDLDWRDASQATELIADLVPRLQSWREL